MTKTNTPHATFTNWLTTALAAAAIVLTAAPASAQRLSEGEIKARVYEFFDKSDDASYAKHRDGSTGSMQSVYTSASGLVKVYDTDSHGCVIATTDRSLPPVLGYTDGASAKDAANVKPLVSLIEAYDNTASASLSPGNDTKGTTVSYLDNEFPEYVLPLLTDEWSQYEPYNMMCPTVDSSLCLTGCVAHSMAEVMRYYRYPERGTGEYTYYDEKGCKQTLTAVFSDHKYDWDNMLDHYDEGGYTQTQAKAVAQLLYDCGVSVNMRYGTSASGAKIVYQPAALVNHFGYDEGLQMRFRSFYTQKEWDSMLKTELANGRPILMVGNSYTESHAFTCDGYDTDGYYHINWGWGGEANGYYYMPFLSPDMSEWFDKDNPERGLNLLQMIVTGVKPRQQQSGQVYSFAFSRIEALDPAAARNGEARVVTHDLANIGWNVYGGTVGVGLKDKSGDITLLADYTHGFELEELVDTAYTDTLTISIPTAVADGRYSLVPVFRQEDGWVEARTETGTPNYLNVSVSKDSISLQTPSAASAKLILTGLTFPDTLVYRKAPSYSLSLKNDGEEYCGILYLTLYTESETGEKRYVFSTQGIELGAGESTTRTFSRTPLNVSPGTYKLRILYQTDMFTGDLTTIYDSGDSHITVVSEGASAIDKTETDTPQTQIIKVFTIDGRLVQTVQESSLEEYRPEAGMDEDIYIISDGKRTIKYKAPASRE